MANFVANLWTTLIEAPTTNSYKKVTFFMQGQTTLECPDADLHMFTPYGDNVYQLHWHKVSLEQESIMQKS